MSSGLQSYHFVLGCPSSEEWQWIKKLAKNQPQLKGWANAEADTAEGEPGENRTDEVEAKNLQPTTAQLLFQSQVQRAAHKLLGSMGIEESVLQHRYCRFKLP